MHRSGLATFVWISVLAAHETSAQPRPSCDVQPSSIVSRSPAGIAQVSNLAMISMQSRVVPARTVPMGGVLCGLKVDATVYEITPNNARTIVSSSVNQSGGGGDSQSEYASFSLQIPVDQSERDAAIREYLADLERAAATSTNEQERALAPTLKGMPSWVFNNVFGQHRLGHFQVECRIFDEGRLVGIGQGELEVLFKGRFFDQEAFRKK